MDFRRLATPTEVTVALDTLGGSACPPGADLPTYDQLAEMLDSGEYRVDACFDGSSCRALWIVRLDTGRIVLGAARAGDYGYAFRQLGDWVYPQVPIPLWGVIGVESVRDELLDAGVAEYRDDMGQYDGAAMRFLP